MSRHLTVNEWIKVILIYKEVGINKAINFYNSIHKKQIKIRRLSDRIKMKSKMVDNNGMEALVRQKGSGRPKKNKNPNYYDIESIINDLTEDAKKIHYRRLNKNSKRKKDSVSKIPNTTMTMNSGILYIHRTTLYKKTINRNYEFEYLKQVTQNIFDSSKSIYGSRRICQILKFNGFEISDRTLRNYMIRWGIFSTTRKKRKVPAEIKNTNVKFKNLVKRDYNPNEDNIIATDVSYIPAKTNTNHVYLSAAISHKTKMIESWELSNSNDSKLVVEYNNEDK